MTSATPSPTPASTPTPTKVATPGAFSALFGLVLRQQLTQSRLVLFLLIGAGSGMLGWLASEDFEPRQATVEVLSVFGIGMVVPLVSLVLGSAALGNWADDETLVYIWLRPVSRWVIAAAATLAASVVALAVNLPALILFSYLGAGPDGEVLRATAVSVALSSLAYVGLFVALGLVIRRALIWGMVYVFIWELFVARAGAGAARLSINSYATSILAQVTGYELPLAERDLNLSYLTLTMVALVTVALTTWLLHRANVD